MRVRRWSVAAETDRLKNAWIGFNTNPAAADILDYIDCSSVFAVLSMDHTARVFCSERHLFPVVFKRQ